MLIGIHVYNYRVLRDVTLGVVREDFERFPERVPAFPLRPLTVLVGENRSGKSSLLEALTFLRNVFLGGLPKPEREEENEILGNLRTFGQSDAPAFELSVLSPSLREILFYRLELADCEGQALIKYESLAALPLSAELLKAMDWDEYLPTSEPGQIEECFRRTSEGQVFFGNGIAEELKPYTTCLQSRVLTEGCFEAAWLKEYFSKICFLHLPGEINGKGKITGYNFTEEGVSLKANGRNLKSYLEKLKQDDLEVYKEMSRNLMRILRIGPEGQILHWLGRLTEAERKLAVISVLLYEEEYCSLLGIENPDYGLFPDKVDVLAQELRNYVITRPDAQVIMTTSHMNLLESLAPREVWTFQNKDGGRNHCTAPDEVPDIHVRCAASDPLVTAMYDEGVGLGTLLYGGYLA